MEKKIIIGTISLTVILSIIFGDLFPFSINPLFTKKTEVFSIVIIKDADERRISNLEMGTYLDYGSKFEKAGISLPPTINIMGHHLHPSFLKDHLIEHLKLYPFLSEIQVTLKNVSLNEKLVPETEESIFSIVNPYFDIDAKVNPSIYKKDKFLRRIKNEALL